MTDLAHFSAKAGRLKVVIPIAAEAGSLSEERGIGGGEILVIARSSASEGNLEAIGGDLTVDRVPFNPPEADVVALGDLAIDGAFSPAGLRVEKIFEMHAPF